MIYKPYFNQSTEWIQFWQKANNDKKHKIITFESNNLKVYVYQYPFYVGTYFWYIPRAMILKEEFNSDGDLKEEIEQVINDINEKAKKNDNIVFLKIDYDLDFLYKYIYNEVCRSPEALLDELNDIKFQKSNKILQYQTTKIISLKTLNYSSDIHKFWNNNAKWFSLNFDKRTRYGTRKALEANWIYDTEKNIENFESFYQLYQETSQRQGFSIHSKNYLKSLLFESFSRLILLKHNGIVHSAWFGIVIDESIINLYGANNMTSRERHGQYFLHLLAINIGIREKCLKYDLGGLEDGKGYNLFKQGYNGDLKTFSETYDIIYKHNVYNTYLIYFKIKKQVLKK